MTTISKLQMATDEQSAVFEPIEEYAREQETKAQVSEGRTLLGKLTMCQRSLAIAQGTLAKAQASGEALPIRAARAVVSMHRAKAAQLQRRIYGNVYSTGRNRKRRR